MKIVEYGKLMGNDRNYYKSEITYELTHNRSIYDIFATRKEAEIKRQNIYKKFAEANIRRIALGKSEIPLKGLRIIRKEKMVLPYIKL